MIAGRVQPAKGCIWGSVKAKRDMAIRGQGTEAEGSWTGQLDSLCDLLLGQVTGHLRRIVAWPLCILHSSPTGPGTGRPGTPGCPASMDRLWAVPDAHTLSVEAPLKQAEAHQGPRGLGGSLKRQALFSAT